MEGAQQIVINGSCEGQRLDNFLLARYRRLPKSHIYRIIRSGEVRINSRRAKPSSRLVTGDTVRVPPIETANRKPPRISDDSAGALSRRIIFENKELMIINKPAGISVHAGTGNSYGLIDLLGKLRPQDQMALAHRLDKSVSGCIAAAKTRPALLALNRAFRENKVEKTYLALVAGHWRKPRTVKLALARNAHKQTVAVQGKPAVSRFEPQSTIGDYTLVAVRIATGRTHQIRVHAAHCGHPVAGDRKYGDFKANRTLQHLGLRRIFLHASRLAFEWRGGRQNFEAPLPHELQTVISALNARGFC